MPLKQYPVIDAQSAIHDYNKKIAGFKEIQARLNPLDKLKPAEANTASLDNYLRSNSLPTSFSVKAALAQKIGMSNYAGKPEQDNQILSAMGNINQKETETKSNEQENKFKDREFSLKEKELGLKEKEIEAKKMPGADEIANSLMSKFNS